MTDTLVLTVAGISFAVYAPDQKWAADLEKRYEAFLSNQSAIWELHLRYEDSSYPTTSSWINHDHQVTSFRVGGFTGFVDLATRQAELRLSNFRFVGSAVDRALSFILMQELPREHCALLLHGAAIVRHGWGLAHSGRSGAGKTTTARLAAGHADVLVDENLVVSLAGNQPELISTPFWGGGTPQEMIHRVNRKVPLRALLLLEHGPDFVLEPLSQGDAVLALLTTEKVAIERVSSASAWLTTTERLVSHVPTYRLIFRPTPDLWPFLDETLNL